ncbi:hypothetical protein GGR42_001617 [Saonia flava]|uniref:DUF664 domain-containing protein n=1 Tax=Saonia flava TaxID=523696 RepID=A0A846QZR3_9FLAO|nr:DUF664 domain-containing protein [Saonia flava]NJB71155.1 hypothetical protein [Saonia flava]
METSRDWTSFVQSLEVSTDRPIKFRVTASAKTEVENESGWSGIWVRVDTKNGESGFFDNMSDRPIITDKWDTYIIEGEINENSKVLNFGGLCINNGKFFFDNFEVSTENSNGEFEKLEIKNASFEEKLSNNEGFSWVEGITISEPVRIKEYSLSLNNEDKVDGKYSLLIEGNGVIRDTTGIIGPIEGFSPQMGTLVTMLNNLSARVERIVTNLDQNELDYLMDEKANSIGALVMHLIATEVYYQSYSFGKDVSYKDETINWDAGMNLGEEGRKNIKGYSTQFYFDLWKKVRAKTVEELKKRDDGWLAHVPPGSDVNNYFYWFHVMEHQSSHLGQILLMRKRIPEFPKEPEIKVGVKD